MDSHMEYRLYLWQDTVNWKEKQQRSYNLQPNATKTALHSFPSNDSNRPYLNRSDINYIYAHMKKYLNSHRFSDYLKSKVKFQRVIMICIVMGTSYMETKKYQHEGKLCKSHTLHIMAF